MNQSQTNTKITQYVTGKGTAIVVLITPLNIFMAGDSKRVYTGSVDGIKTETVVCKIHSRRGVFFALSHHATFCKGDIENPIFDATKEFDTVCKNTYGYEIVLETYDKIIKEKMNELLQLFYDEGNYEYLDDYIQKAGFGITICQYIKKKPRVVCRTYKFTGTHENWDIETEDLLNIENISPSEIKIMPMGADKEIRLFINGGSHFPEKIATERERLNFLISLEVVANPGTVGAPIRIIQINKDNSAKWLQNPC